MPDTLSQAPAAPNVAADEDARVAFELLYVAYPSSLELKSANAVQTFNTLRELQARRPHMNAFIPRWGRRRSAFADLGVHHLVRLPFNVFGHVWRTAFWSYLERSWFAWRVTAHLVARPVDVPRVLYVRDAICAAWLGAGLARLAGVALVYEVHDLEQWNPSRAKSFVGTVLARAIDSLAIRRPDRVVTLTAAFQRYVERVGLRASTTSAVIPDAYDDALYFPRDRDAARRALGLDPGGYTIVYAGLTFSYRGLDNLVRAFARLIREVPEAKLVLVGGREREREFLAGLARDLGVADALTMPGQRPTSEIPEYLAAADVLVAAGTVSGLNASPLKLFEYAAMNRPIVAIESVALREILGTDGALYFPAGDEAALAGALARPAMAPIESKQMAARARELVRPLTYRARAAAIVAVAAGVARAMSAPRSSPRT